MCHHKHLFIEDLVCEAVVLFDNGSPFIVNNMHEFVANCYIPLEI